MASTAANASPSKHKLEELADDAEFPDVSPPQKRRRKLASCCPVSASGTASDAVVNGKGATDGSGARKRGVFIVFEGIDRCGKSTQSQKLQEYLKSNEIKYQFLRYPNRDSQSGKLINQYLQGTTKMNDRAIHLLFAANRHEDTSKIVDLLNSGVNIVCDRYSYSGAAYSSAKIKASHKGGKTIDSTKNECKSEEIVNVHDKENGDSNSEKKDTSNGSKNNSASDGSNNNKANANEEEAVMDLNWCLTCEQGLPKPDKIIYLNLDLAEAEKRGGFGDEVYEKPLFLRRVQKRYHEIIDKDKKLSGLWNIVDADRSKEEIHKDITAILHQTIKDSSGNDIEFI